MCPSNDRRVSSSSPIDGRYINSFFEFPKNTSVKRKKNINKTFKQLMKIGGAIRTHQPLKARWQLIRRVPISVGVAWYSCDLSLLPPDLASTFIHLTPDDETELFLDKCREKSDWVLTQIFHTLLKSILGWFMTSTTINSWLQRGSMFVFSRKQLLHLLGMRSSWRGSNLLDIGAGDGNVTSIMAPLFDRVYVTEASSGMRNLLHAKGFTILDVESWTQMENEYDVISILNVLDRCDRPLTMLKEAIQRLKPGSGRLLVALALPFSSYVESGKSDHKPSEVLPIEGSTFEHQVNSVVNNVFTTCGLQVESWARVPYLCEGDLHQSFYWLFDAIFIFPNKYKQFSFHFATHQQQPLGKVCAGKTRPLSSFLSKRNYWDLFMGFANAGLTNSVNESSPHLTGDGDHRPRRGRGRGLGAYLLESYCDDAASEGMLFDTLEEDTAITCVAKQQLLMTSSYRSASVDRERATPQYYGSDSTKFLPVLERYRANLPEACPLAPQRDVYGIQESQKLEEGPANWRCGLCGKSFYSEAYLDRHFDSRHFNVLNMRSDAVCLARYCDIMRCEVLITKQGIAMSMAVKSTETLSAVAQLPVMPNVKSNLKQSGWTERCQEKKLRELRNKCQVVIRDCISGLLLNLSLKDFKEIEEDLNKAVCSYLTCEKYWENPLTEIRQFPVALAVLFLCLLVTGISSDYYGKEDYGDAVLPNHVYTEHLVCVQYNHKCELRHRMME
uniref:C2H2-type domain-containing protein n=1 Tax=Strigamia maritima TaxID=126957 RepID=T1J491_STRMM